MFNKSTSSILEPNRSFFKPSLYVFSEFWHYWITPTSPASCGTSLPEKAFLRIDWQRRSARLETKWGIHPFLSLLYTSEYIRKKKFRYKHIAFFQGIYSMTRSDMVWKTRNARIVIGLKILYLPCKIKGNIENIPGSIHWTYNRPSFPSFARRGLRRELSRTMKGRSSIDYLPY